MKLENQVTSLEPSKSLEKFRVKQDSMWMWVMYKLWKEPQIWHSDLATDVKITCLSGKRVYAYSAFTVAELGEMLPAYPPARLERQIGFNMRFVKEKHSNVWLVGYKKLYIDDWWKVEEAKTEVEATAKLLIHLLKNKSITLSKIK